MIKPSQDPDCFPILQHNAYFDHAAISPLPAPVARAATEFLNDARDHGSANFFRWRDELDRTRAGAADFLKVDQDEIALIHSTSEGINIVASGIPFEAGDNIVTVAQEFPANRLPWLRHEKQGVELRVAPLDQNRINVDAVLERVDKNTRIVTLSYVSFLHGARADLPKLAEGIKARSGALFFVDAIQGLGALPLYPESWGIDMLAADGHKWLLAPEGIGLFWCRKSKLELIKPAHVSWLSVTQPFDVEPYCEELLPNAKRFEYGSPNSVGAYALRASLDILRQEGIESIAESIKNLTTQLSIGLERRGYRVLSPREEEHWSGIVSFTHSTHSPRDIRHRLKEALVTVSERGEWVRAAPHFYNKPEQIDQLLEAIQ